MPSAPGAEPQQQLSLFDDAPPPVAVGAGVAPGPVAAPLAAPAPPRFDHPQAYRRIVLEGALVGYRLRRARRRSIGFVVGADGLTVSAPRWVGVGEIEAALREKAAWIVRKLHEQHERARRVQASRIAWREGGTVPFLGQTVILVLDARVAGAQLREAPDTLPGVPKLTLHLGLPEDAGEARIRDTVQGWLQRQARRVFEERCAHFAARLGVRVTRVALSSATTRWGSASADGSVRLHWRLVHFGLAVIDYVVAHELSHLREMNHGPAFWAVVRSVLPDYERARGALRAQVLPAFDL